ncbi:hypothetical protein PNA2_1771 [Pyrococcus sp. NA2]|uniref:DUF257 family protein n=1 Tax=Pyrococcus sp. (strain NA2) TaxID=342949 RepID=UPI000209AB93|nr:DUF257 family protein [Pyrococcus sp. NA2]AEC52686.1 hypothetical protein PNA2_1771 [Pyrococcus sp. NA2]
MWTFEKLVDEIRFGETVIMFYPGSSYVREFITVKLLEYSRNKGIKIVIDDNLDSLSIVQRNLKILGIEEDFKDVYVIKTGGKQDIGGKILRVGFHSDPRVYIQWYAEVAEELKEVERFINIVFGIEDLFRYLNSAHEIYSLILNLQRFLGNTKRKAFYLLNEDILDILPPHIKLELKRIATTVVRATQDFIVAHLDIEKSPNPGLVGKEITLELEGVK